MSKKLLLLPLAIGLSGLLIQACNQHPAMLGEIDWPGATKRVEVKPAGCSDDDCREKAYKTALEKCHATKWGSSFASAAKRFCHVIEKDEGVRDCGHVPDSIHVAQHVYFANDTDYKCFRSEMGLP